ncbi:MAG: hypothetical protein ACRD1V_19745 [Vicinamibacterales bacterium]
MVDLVTEFAHAEARPSGAYSVAFHDAAGTTLAAIVGPAPGRIIWTLPVPREARFRMRVAVEGGTVRVRLGVSDTRVYEPLAARTVTPGAPWSDFAADLSEYAGMKFSLFYHPDARLWRINLTADALDTAATVAYALPQIAAPMSEAAEYARRSARLAIHNGAP